MRRFLIKKESWKSEFGLSPWFINPRTSGGNSIRSGLE